MNRCWRFLIAVGAVTAAAGAAQLNAVPNWQMIKSVPHPTGGTQEFIVIPPERQWDVEFYRDIANTVCGKRTRCMVFYWTNLENIPKSTSFNAPSMHSLVGQYERHPNYHEPHLRLACWLYTSKLTSENTNCFSMPGANVPPNK